MRKFIDDYRVGKVEIDTTIIDKLDEQELSGKFLIAWVEPFVGGGLFLQIIFVDRPQNVYSAWIYSYVDEVREVVTGYDCRMFKKEDEKSGYNSKEELLKKAKATPGIILW